MNELFIDVWLRRLSFNTFLSNEFHVSTARSPTHHHNCHVGSNPPSPCVTNIYLSVDKGVTRPIWCLHHLIVNNCKGATYQISELLLPTRRGMFPIFFLLFRLQSRRAELSDSCCFMCLQNMRTSQPMHQIRHQKTNQEP